MIQNLQIGEIVRTDELQAYLFVEYYDDEYDLPFYYQVDIQTYEVVDVYPAELFDTINEGFRLEVGGKITAIERD